MKNDIISTINDSKKKINLQIGKHTIMLFVWIAIYFIVWFQPEGTLRTWVLFISVVAIFRRIWQQGRCFGVYEILNIMFGSSSGKESSLDELSANLQKVGNAGIKANIESKKTKKEQE